MSDRNEEVQDRHELSLEDVCRLVGGRVEGSPDVRVHDLVPLDQAGPGELGFLTRASYAKLVQGSNAEAILVREDLVPDLPAERPPLVIVGSPGVALAQLLEVFHPEPVLVPEIHPTAVLGRNVKLGRDVSIGPYAVIEADAVLGDRARIGSHCVIGQGARIGDDSVLYPHVVLYAGTVLGRRVILHAGTRVGVDGFGYVYHEGAHRKVRQVGGCTVGDDVEMGANCCIDRGSIGHTEIGAGAKLDNLVHIAHNVVIGRSALLVAQVGIAGSTRIGAGASLGGQVGVAGHLEVGDGAQVAAKGGVIGDIPSGATVMGFPARPQREFLRATAALFRLPELIRRIRKIEERLKEEDRKE